MSTNTLEQLKHAKSSLQAERLPVSQIQGALKQAKRITKFVHIALAKENRWIFQAGEPECIVSMLGDINRINKELYEKCRSPEHFNREADRFLRMKKQIERQADCIHLSLDQGFYGTEPLGLSPAKAIELSLKKIKSIRDGHQKGKWVSLPIDAAVDDAAKTEVEELYSGAASLAGTLLNNQNFSSFDQPMTIEEVQDVYKYFKSVSRIQDLEKEALRNTLAKKREPQILKPDELLEKLSKIQQKLKNVNISNSKNIPDWGIELCQISRTDMILRMYLLRIPFEPLGFFQKHLEKLKEQKESGGIEKSISEFHENAKQELENLQLFIETFGGVEVTLREVTGILQNLSISFGKIYHNASSQTITSTFLHKVLALIKGMLEKGGRVADSKTQKLNQLQKIVKDFELFDAPINEGMLYALDLLEEGKNEMIKYCERIHGFVETLSNASDWNSRKTYNYLQTAYDENASLTSAAMVFGSVTQTSVLLKSSIKEVESIWLELGKLREQNLDSEALYEQTIAILERDAVYSEKKLQKSTEQVEELNWIIDEMFGQGAQEEQRFLAELKSELKPVETRIQARKIKAEAQPEGALNDVKKTDSATIQRKSKSRKSDKSSKSELFSSGGKKSVYDPFPPFEMTALKEACKTMTSSEGKMIYQVLTNTHTFFTLLNKMENSFKVGEGLENELEQDLSNSKTTHEFLNNFARFKFLPHGYYSNNNAPFDYNEKKHRFEVPQGIERQLKLSASSTGSPLEVFRRLIRVLLGFDDPKTISTIMPQQILSILEEDFMLKSQDRKIVMESLQKT